jgi:hypothetical protein
MVGSSLRSDIQPVNGHGFEFATVNYAAWSKQPMLWKARTENHSWN